jgi:superfamily I DNA and/or RNA helicase
MFDTVIMDEAGQCNIATALIPITKAKSLVLVGDPRQLRPVIVLDDSVNKTLMDEFHISENYNYKKNSILDVMLFNDKISKNILLSYHYRCGRKIIKFSNQRYYNNELNLSHLKSDGNLEILDIKNKNVKYRNEAFDEASAIVNYIKRNNIHNVFIVTPFINQRDLINMMLKKENINDVHCGTIHSLQGAEKDTIIFSLAISLKTQKKNI